MAKTPQKRIKVRVVVQPNGRDLPLPKYQTAGAAGMDLLAALPADKPVKLKRGGRALIPTGLVIELPRGYEAQVRPRSGLALRSGVTVLNSPGTIDCDYRGEVQVILVNLGEGPFTVQRGERIAQMVIAPVVQGDLVEAATARATARGAGGFGSTGLAAKPRAAVAKAKTGAKARVISGAKRKKAQLPAFPRRSTQSSSRGRR